jgi:hypothetical protein
MIGKKAHPDSLEIQGEHITVTADPNEFAVWDNDDQQRKLACMERGRRSAAKFYQWASENKDSIVRMTFVQINQAMFDLGIGCSYLYVIH